MFEVLLTMYTARMAETRKMHQKLRRMTKVARHPDMEEQCKSRHPDMEEQCKSNALRQCRRRTMEEQQQPDMEVQCKSNAFRQCRRRTMEEQQGMTEEQRGPRVSTRCRGHQTRGRVVDWPQRLKQRYCRLLHGNRDMARFGSRIGILGMDGRLDHFETLLRIARNAMLSRVWAEALMSRTLHAHVERQRIPRSRLLQARRSWQRRSLTSGEVIKQQMMARLR